MPEKDKKKNSSQKPNNILSEGLEKADKHEQLLMKDAYQEIKEHYSSENNTDKEVISALKLSAEMSLLNLQTRHLQYLKNNKVKEDNFEKLDVVKELKRQINEYDLKLSAISKKNNS